MSKKRSQLAEKSFWLKETPFPVKNSWSEPDYRYRCDFLFVRNDLHCLKYDLLEFQGPTGPWNSSSCGGLVDLRPWYGHSLWSPKILEVARNLTLDSFMTIRDTECNTWWYSKIPIMLIFESKANILLILLNFFILIILKSNNQHRILLWSWIFLFLWYYFPLVFHIYKEPCREMIFFIFSSVFFYYFIFNILIFYICFCLIYNFFL